MASDLSTNTRRFTGWADLYDQYRAGPPEALAGLLARYAGITRPELVVDLGSGTGLSTRYWADKAARVVGIEPTPDMRRQAEAVTEALNISYQEGYSHDTGLPAGSADLVVCMRPHAFSGPAASLQPAIMNGRRALVLRTPRPLLSALPPLAGSSKRNSDSPPASTIGTKPNTWPGCSKAVVSPTPVN
jgi:SAM-dependent methyltransferase